MSPEKNPLASVVARSEKEIVEEWVRLQRASPGRRSDLMGEKGLGDQSRQVVAAFRKGVEGGDRDTSGPGWSEMRDLLAQLSKERAQVGFTARETALFLLSLKEALVPALKAGVTNSEALAAETWQAGLLVDSLAVLSMEQYQKEREGIISRQQQELLELSTPVVQLWQNILALPLIGTLDSARTQVVMENLLQSIVDTSATIAIIDITGVPTVDTLVAQHLLKTVAAARLMGADCIISGIRPQIAQTIVHLGVELGEVTTKATLADAFALALRRNGLTVARAAVA
jgi:rsbT co-antagonist protein RsbR